MQQAWETISPLIEARCFLPAALRWVCPGSLEAASLALADARVEEAKTQGFEFYTAAQRTDYMRRWLADNAAEARREADAVTLAWAMQEDSLLWCEDGGFSRVLFAIEERHHGLPARTLPWTPERQLLAFLTAKVGNMPGVAEFGDGAAMRSAAKAAMLHRARPEVTEDFCALVAFVLGKAAEFAARFLEGERFVRLNAVTVARMGRAVAGMLGAREHGTAVHWWVRARTVPYAVPVMALAAEMAGRDLGTGRLGAGEKSENPNWHFLRVK